MQNMKWIHIMFCQFIWDLLQSVSVTMYNLIMCYSFLCPHSKRADLNLSLSVRLSVRPSDLFILWQSWKNGYIRVHISSKFQNRVLFDVALSHHCCRFESQQHGFSHERNLVTEDRRFYSGYGGGGIWRDTWYLPQPAINVSWKIVIEILL